MLVAQFFNIDVAVGPFLSNSNMAAVAVLNQFNGSEILVLVFDGLVLAIVVADVVR